MFFRASANVGGDIIDAILEYLRIFFLQELSAYFKVYQVFEGHREAIEGLYESIGLIDASIALLDCLEDGELGAVRAELSDGAVGFSAEALVHPLVEGCVPNSVSFSRGAILTGTNMAGKSTFLRAIGISQACATSLGLAFAAGWEGGFLLVMSSMSCEDDLERHKSRYFVEAERMMAILRASASGLAPGQPAGLTPKPTACLTPAPGRPVLALVDEILVGTNSEDRIFASIRMLRRIAGTSSLAIAATHDLPIAEALGAEYDCLHFSERIEGEELVFDYLVKPGVVDRRNALDILGLLGFDEEILGRA
jgi:DNA mismatch repair ATPase MutS